MSVYIMCACVCIYILCVGGGIKLGNCVIASESSIYKISSDRFLNNIVLHRSFLTDATLYAEQTPYTIYVYSVHKLHIVCICIDIFIYTPAPV